MDADFLEQNCDFFLGNEISKLKFNFDQDKILAKDEKICQSGTRATSESLPRTLQNRLMSERKAF